MLTDALVEEWSRIPEFDPQFAASKRVVERCKVDIQDIDIFLF